MTSKMIVKLGINID